MRSRRFGLRLTPGSPRSASSARLPYISTLTALDGAPWRFLTREGCIVHSPVAARYRVDSAALACIAAEQGVGFALLPEPSCREALRSERYRSYHWSSPPRRSTCWSCTRVASIRRPKCVRYWPRYAPALTGRASGKSNQQAKTVVEPEAAALRRDAPRPTQSHGDPTGRQRALQAPHEPPNNKSKKALISQGLFVLLRGGDLNLRVSVPARAHANRPLRAQSNAPISL